VMVKNLVALGAMVGATELFPPATLHTVIGQAFSAKPELLAINSRAFDLGLAAAGGR
jgi:2-oxoisovalerate ferredoxin oxidoreductase beta subunit